MVVVVVVFDVVLVAAAVAGLEFKSMHRMSPCLDLATSTVTILLKMCILRVYVCILHIGR